MYDLSKAEIPHLHSSCFWLCGCTWISSEFCGDWLRRLRRDLISSISMGQAALGTAFPFFLQYYCFHALPQQFSHCFSQFGLQFEDFLSFTHPCTSFPDSSFFQLQKLPILFLILCMFFPLFFQSSFLLSLFPFFSLSHSVW